MWIQNFPSLRPFAVQGLKNLINHCWGWGDVLDSYLSERELALCEMQRASSRIWTRVAKCIFYNEKEKRIYSILLYSLICFWCISQIKIFLWYSDFFPIFGYINKYIQRELVIHNIAQNKYITNIFLNEKFIFFENKYTRIFLEF